MQLPRASWIKPTPHLTLGWQRNDPWVFWHSNSGPQLWIPVTHSSISGWRNHSTTAFEHTVNTYKNMTHIHSNRGKLRAAWLTFAVVVVSEFIASPTADLSLATERALCVDTTLSSLTVAGSQQTLVNIWVECLKEEILLLCWSFPIVTHGITVLKLSA